MARAVRFDRGTLILEGFPAQEAPEGFVFDPRVQLLRGNASRYADLILDYHRRGEPLRDEARQYRILERPHRSTRAPRDYQAQAVTAWRGAGRRGTVILPTGAGKSLVAELCIADAGRSALVVAPTLDLVGQWYDNLKAAFGEPIGIVGGGAHEVHDLTVTTYDSAWMYMERYGNRFGLLVFDEVHHLPSPSYAAAALHSLAPFRLGLTATLERPDDAHHWIDELVGPVVFRKEIVELSGDWLSEYRTEVITVALSDEERRLYEEARACFRGFVDEKGVRMGGAGGWQAFLRVAARSAEGRRAFRAWQDSRRTLQGARSKLEVLADLLRRHTDRRAIVFTNDNATVHEISRRLLIPAITHQTDVRERQSLLSAFAGGDLPALVTSRVLNEGVDLPGADVAIVLSGTQTVREHVQRLGRILRKKEGKQAVLYEIVVSDSIEERQSERRRDHAAYRPDR